MGSHPTLGGLLRGTESTIRMGTRAVVAVDDGGWTAPQVGLTPHLRFRPQVSNESVGDPQWSPPQTTLSYG